MSCEHLICARCAGPVSEGRCPACRQARGEIHHSHQSRLGIPLLLLVALAALVLMLTLHLH
jgi:hypothetical protein